MSGATAIAGVVVASLYERRREDARQPWRSRPDWAVSQRVDDPDPVRANAAALLDLEGGADALTLVGRRGLASRGYGLAAPGDLPTVLEKVELDLIGLRLDAGIDTQAFADGLAALVEARRLGSAQLGIDLGYDPVALHACGLAPEEGTGAALVAIAERLGASGRPLLCDARPWHEAGAVEARELGVVLATAVAHFRRLEAVGLTLDAARRAVAVLLPFDADVLLGLAKARAMRRLWASLEAACGLQPAPLMLHAETSWRMMTRYDPHTNAMRATAAVHAAGLGGADSITVLPMSLVGALPDVAARRLARNTGRVLLDEAELAAVGDPAAGSGAYESLTEELCAQAWTVFQAIERRGGIHAALDDGSLHAELDADARLRREGAEHFKRGITGTSLFPHLDAPGPEVEDNRRQGRHPVGGISRRRDAEAFELLRMRADAVTPRPTVFLATLGTPADFGPRANQAANLFASVGIAATAAPLAMRDVSTLVADYARSGARAACLCGSDAACLAEGATVAAALAAAGADTFAMAVEVPATTVLMPSGATTLPVLRALLEQLLH